MYDGKEAFTKQTQALLAPFFQVTCGGITNHTIIDGHWKVTVGEQLHLLWHL